MHRFFFSTKDTFINSGSSILDGTTLSTLMGNFLGAFKGATGITVLMTLLTAAGTIGLGMAASPSAAVKASGGILMGMTAIGLGLAGFFTALTIGDFITSALTPAGKAPGASIKTLMDNFFGIFDNPLNISSSFYSVNVYSVINISWL